MNQPANLELRIRSLVSAYADRAPVNVDAAAVARLVAGTPPHHFARVGFGRGRPRIWLALAGLSALALGAAALGGGGIPRTTPRATDVAPTAGAVAPTGGTVPTSAPPSPSFLSTFEPEPGRVGFIGLPPVGALPSEPESAQALFTYYSRSELSCCAKLGFDLYPDGRVIWEIEADRAFGATTATTGLIEQRLSEAGVALLMDMVTTRLPHVAPGHVAVAHFFFGGITVRVGATTLEYTWGRATNDRMLEVTDADRDAIHDMDARLRDLSWLPADAWLEATPRGFVPARYVVCGAADDGSPLPLDVNATAFAVLEGHASTVDGSPTCLSLALDDTRAFVDALTSAGYRRLFDDYYLTYRPRPGGPGTGDVQIDPILPNGEARCRCG